MSQQDEEGDAAFQLEVPETRIGTSRRHHMPATSADSPRAEVALKAVIFGARMVAVSRREVLMSRSLRQRAANRDGRALMTVLGVVVLFGISSVLGFYVIGPLLMNRSAPATQTEAQVEDTSALPEPGRLETAPRKASDSSESLKLDVDITENGAGAPAGTRKESEKQPEATPADAAVDEGATGSQVNEKPAPTAPKRDESEKPAQPRNTTPSQPVKENEPAVAPKPSVEASLQSHLFGRSQANEVASSVRSAGIQAYVVKGVLNAATPGACSRNIQREGQRGEVVAQLKKQAFRRWCSAASRSSPDRTTHEPQRRTGRTTRPPLPRDSPKCRKCPRNPRFSLDCGFPRAT